MEKELFSARWTGWWVWLTLWLWGPMRLESASLSSISDMLTFPLQWTQRSIEYKTAGACVITVDQNTWILGGKAIGVDNDISNTARKQKFTRSTTSTLINDEVLQVPGSFPGQYVNSPGMYCTLGAQVAYGTYFGLPITQKMCYLGANDGTSNRPQCGCCSVEKGTSKVPCDDLDALSLCPPVFGSCVVNDYLKNRAIQIGGNTGTRSVNNTLCFDIAREKYTADISSILKLDGETIITDPLCEYGNLVESAHDVGCGMMPDAGRSIIVVGGRAWRSSTSNFLDTVQVCKADSRGCQRLSLKLPQPTSQMRVLGLTSCVFIAFGGLTATGTLGKTYVGDICDQKWLYTENLPAALNEFSLVVGGDVLCLYGGIIGNQLQNTAYCTNFNPPKGSTTPRPTARPTKLPTRKPTRRPTTVPTKDPTPPGLGVPEFFQGWNEEYVWADGRDSQTCYANDGFFFVLGGKNGAQKTLNTLSAFDYNYNKREFQMYQYDPLLSSRSMIPFYCKNSCAGGYLNRVYLVNPYSDDGASTTPRLFECVINTSGSSAVCRDLCDGQVGTLPYCESVLFWDACVTAQDQYLYIVGGRDVKRRDSITVFDMAKRDWYSVPKGSPAATKYSTRFGNLKVSVTNAACAAWNYNVFVFGGQTSTTAVTDSIQKCAINSDSCTLQNAKLKISRYYASASTIGSTVVILCGAHDSQTLTDVVELYDVAADSITVDYSGNTPGLVLNTAQRSCCVSRWDSQSSLVMTGGVSMEGTYLANSYSLFSAPFAIQERSATGKPLTQCDSLMLQSSNPSFFGGFFYYVDVQDYRIWVSNQFDSVIYYKKDNSDYTWIGNLSSQLWSYYGSVGFRSDYWTIVASKNTGQQNLYFTFTCLDNQMYEKDSDSDTRILGLSVVVFWVIVATIGLVLILIGVGIWYWIKRYKMMHREITIQSATGDSRKKVLITTQSVTQKSNEPEREHESSNSDELGNQLSSHPSGATPIGDGIFGKTSSTTTKGEELEQRPLNTTEVEAVEHGGVHIQGYQSAIVSVDDDAEDVSSVESEEVHFKDNKIFGKAGHEQSSH